jgi:hypothetical protein
MKNLHAYPPMKMEQTECSEMLQYKNSNAGELPRRKHATRNVLPNYVIHNIL